VGHVWTLRLLTFPPLRCNASHGRMGAHLERDNAQIVRHTRLHRRHVASTSRRQNVPPHCLDHFTTARGHARHRAPVARGVPLPPVRAAPRTRRLPTTLSPLASEYRTPSPSPQAVDCTSRSGSNTAVPTTPANGRGATATSTVALGAADEAAERGNEQQTAQKRIRIRMRPSTTRAPPSSRARPPAQPPAYWKRATSNVDLSRPSGSTASLGDRPYQQVPQLPRARPTPPHRRRQQRRPPQGLDRWRRRPNCHGAHPSSTGPSGHR